MPEAEEAASVQEVIMTQLQLGRRALFGSSIVVD